MKLSPFSCLVLLVVLPLVSCGWKNQEQQLQFRHQPNTPNSRGRHLHEDGEYFRLVSDDSEDGGCLVVKDSDTDDGTSLILGTCGGSTDHDKWRYDDDSGLFYSKLDDDNKCMQAGHGGVPSHGTKMRLYTCDENNALQQFEYDHIRIVLKGENLCVVFRGVTGDVGEDSIILKWCDESDGQDNWSED